MRFISHRGNVQGPNNLENSPSQVDWCLNQSLDCEVDLWVQNGVYLLGHDFGQYIIERDWLLDREGALWIHCKNIEALHSLRSLERQTLNFFWHQEDTYTLTSRNFIWVYPGDLVVPGSIAVLPEKWITDERFNEISTSYGICTDYVLEFKNKFDVVTI